jgi:hypothetical protein
MIHPKHRDKKYDATDDLVYNKPPGFGKSTPGMIRATEAEQGVK